MAADFVPTWYLDGEDHIVPVMARERGESIEGIGITHRFVAEYEGYLPIENLFPDERSALLGLLRRLDGREWEIAQVRRQTRERLRALARKDHTNGG